LKVARTAVCTGFCLAWIVVTVQVALSPPLAASPSEIAPSRFRPVQPMQRVRVARGAEGRKVIFNETTVDHARRFAADLLPVPDLPGLPSGALEPIIARRSGEHHLDPRLVRAVIQVESGYNRRARSNHGAMGLMQLMPDTALELAVHDPYDADENLRGGTTYLAQLIDAFPSSLEMALAAYNAGPGAVERHRGVPPYPETIDYVRRVMTLYRGGPAGVVQASSSGLRPAPRVTRGSNGRLVVTTSLSGLR
jgi:soluble lytic murein transglycosylase-like protein